MNSNQYFDRATYDQFEGTLEIDFAQNSRTPIAYRGQLYYLHYVDPTKLGLVLIDEIYRSDPKSPVLKFIPQSIRYVYPHDFDLEYIKTVASFAQNQVAVFYADVLIDQEPAMIIETKNSKHQLNLTGIHYLYDDETNTYRPEPVEFVNEITLEDYE